jgi:hypothetical protein
MSNQSFEEKYLDVLQNLELNIVGVARQHAEMSDWDALNAVEALIKTYRAEAAGREASPSKLSPLAEETYEILESMCRWLSGRGSFVNDDDGEPIKVPIEPITAEEILACLKRIRRSIPKWTKRGGRRGYLTFIDQFLPTMPDAEESSP